MTLRFVTYCRASAHGLQVLSLVLGCAALGADKPHGRPIEFSEPKRAEISTNLNQLTLKHDGLRELQEDLFKPLQNAFSPKGSLDGLDAEPMLPPVAPMVPNKKAKELLERKKNWVFQNPDDLTRGLTAEQIFNLPEFGPDGKERKPGSAVENYYERLGRQHPTRSGLVEEEDILGLHKVPKSKDGLDRGRDLEEKRGNAGFGQVSESERNLRRIFDSAATGTGRPADSARSTSSDLFGLGESSRVASPTPEEVEAHKLYMKQFQQLFNAGSSPSLGTADLQSSIPGINDSRPSTSGFDALSSMTRPNGFDAPSALSPSMAPTGLPDANGKLANPWAVPAAPKVEAPKVPAPPSPIDFPRRAFF